MNSISAPRTGQSCMNPSMSSKQLRQKNGVARNDMNQQLCKRDRRLDALRGLMLVIITIDHLPSAFAAFTYQSLGFVSAAEGFVFLSGYVAGMVYAPFAVNGCWKELW